MNHEDVSDDALDLDEAGAEEKSKSQRKRESDALQEIGEALVALSAKDLARIPMPESLASAVETARGIRKHGAMKRQRQYIGKIMRSIDVEPVIAAYEAVLDRDRLANAHFHQLELWRDRLLEEGDPAVEALIEVYPDLDRQHLRQLLRGAQREQAQGKPPGSARNLFRYLRELAGD